MTLGFLIWFISWDTHFDRFRPALESFIDVLSFRRRVFCLFILSFLLSVSVSSFLRSSNNIYRSSNNGKFKKKKNPVEQCPPGKCVFLRVYFKIQVNFQCILDIMLCCYMRRIDWIGLSFTTLFCWIYGISSV